MPSQVGAGGVGGGHVTLWIEPLARDSAVGYIDGVNRIDKARGGGGGLRTLAEPCLLGAAPATVSPPP